MTVFLAFAKEACELGRCNVWAVDEVDRQALEFLRLLAIRARSRYADYDIVHMIEGRHLTTDARRLFEATPEWRHYQDGLLSIHEALGTTRSTIENAKVLLESHPNFPSANVQIYEQLQRDRFGERLGACPAASPPRMEIVLDALDVRAQAYLRLVDDLALQKAFLVALGKMAHTAWVELTDFPVEESNLSSPMAQRWWATIMARVGHWENEGFKKLALLGEDNTTRATAQGWGQETREVLPRSPATVDSQLGCGDQEQDSSGATSPVASLATAFTPEDRRFAEMAILEARRSVSEDDQQPHPKVGAVVVRDGQLLDLAHRGEVAGCHAEYIALECKLAETSLVGATVYTTLEPCTVRNHPKVPCAHRLVERKVKRVVIGMLDPNPVITGRGQLILREANIITDLFPHDLMSQVEELNRDFRRLHKTASAGVTAKAVPDPPGVIPAPIPVPRDRSDRTRHQGMDADRRTLDDLLTVLPSRGAIQFLRTNNFAGFAFDWEELNDLHRFGYERSGPDHEFIDPEIESLRRDLQEKCNSLTGYLAMNTWAVGPLGEGRYSSVPEEWESEQPERFQRVVATIHTQAQGVCDAYDQLIRTARRKLLS